MIVTKFVTILLPISSGYYKRLKGTHKALVYSLFEKGVIKKAKAVDCLIELKEIGWFKPEIIDSIMREIREVE